MTLQASVTYKPPKYMKVYVPTLKWKTLKSFSEVSTKGDIEVYGAPIEKIQISDYITSSAFELESVYEQLFARRILPQLIERREPMRESLSALKPELAGLVLGGVLSFGIGMFALATHNIGVATVMAGPFLASILGFALLFGGLKRKRQ